MRVVVHPADTGGCGHLRLMWPAEALAARGHDVEIALPGMQDTIGFSVARVGGKAAVKLIHAPDCDVLVLQRTLDWKWKLLIPQLRAGGIRVVVDLDDDFRAVRADHVTYWRIHPRESPGENVEHLDAALAAADLVTVTTDALAWRYRKLKPLVVPNCVPAHYLSIGVAKESALPTVGWPGVVSTHPGDLNVLRGALRMACQRAPFRFKVIGELDGVAEAAGWNARIDHQPYVTMDRYAYELAKLDVGIVPLAQHPFNEAKSWLKGLEMAAVGVPFVASPTTPYQQLAREGAGVLAADPKRWAQAIGALVSDRAWRAEVTARGRETAARWTIEGNAWRWEQAWLGIDSGPTGQ